MEFLRHLFGLETSAIIAAGATVLVGLLTIGATIFAGRQRSKKGPAVPATAVHQTANSAGPSAQVGQAHDVTINQGGATEDLASGIARGLAAHFQSQIDTYEATVQSKNEEIAALTNAVAALTAQAAQPGAPPAIEVALARLRDDQDPAAAEAIFEDVLARKKAAGQSAFKEAAEAARHLGALAFLHDTQKALRAYTEAVELDPDDPDGWNELGRLRMRVGDLDGAAEAYERVLRLGNSVDDRTVIAVATGNLGVIHRTRGDLDKAEEFLLKSLALDEELGRKEGMANQYGNLGAIARQRGDVPGACRLWADAKRLFEEVGARDKVAQVQSSMDEAGCL